MAEAAGVKSRRVEFNFGPEQAKSIDMLMVHCGANTKREVFNNAIVLLEWATEEARAGRRIVSVNRKGEDLQFVQLPMLEQAAKMTKGADS